MLSPILLLCLLTLGYQQFSAVDVSPLRWWPLLNPTDLLCAAGVLAVLHWQQALRQLVARQLLPAPRVWLLPQRSHLLPQILLFVWCNLELLRTLAQWQALPWEFDALFAAQLVQVALSLLWSSYALVLMYRAARRSQRLEWGLGAGLLGLVVLKLFLVDLSQAGSIARIVSFIGAGVLMVAIGYLAPWPGQSSTKDQA